tara:strand:+ start:9082 stop:9321 length:240 start_codon:yes stop_codon:yes gene_type:complete
LGLEQQIFRSLAGSANIINLSILLTQCSMETLSAYGVVKKMKLFEEISEHGIFHGIANHQKYNLLKIKYKNIFFIVEWE